MVYLSFKRFAGDDGGKQIGWKSETANSKAEL
jgi:hypothetical protein